MEKPTPFKTDHLTETQKSNLKTLADYLAGLPTNYQHFDMGDWATNNFDDYDETSPVSGGITLGCGTVACAVGHGPNAGIAPGPNDTQWSLYAENAFGYSAIKKNEDETGYYLFGAVREYFHECSYDAYVEERSPHMAAERIYEVLASIKEPAK